MKKSSKFKVGSSKLEGIPFRSICVTGDKLLVRFDKDKLKEVTAKQGTSYHLEVIKDGRLGSSTVNQPDDEYLVRKALESAEFGDEADYSYPARQSLPQVKLFSEPLSKIQADSLIETGRFLIEAIKEENPNILVDVALERSEGVGTLTHSGGFTGEQRETSLVVAVNGDLVSEGDILSVSDYFAWREDVFERVKFAALMRRKFAWAEKVVETDSGSLPVIFSPDALTTLLGFVETALSANTVYRKVSKWQGEVGKQVADPRLTIIDDPTVDFAGGSTTFDDEGFAAKPLTLIKEGVLQNFYTDLKNAKRLGFEPNGRGFGVPANPALTNVLISPGEKSSQEILSGIKRGIWIDQVLGGGQDSPYTGDFSLNIHLGFLIENGEVVGRVKDMMVSGNVFEMLKNKLGEISSDREWVGGSLHLPYLSFLDTTVTGS